MKDLSVVEKPAGGILFARTIPITVGSSSARAVQMGDVELVSDEFTARIKSEIARAGHASSSVLARIEQELERERSAELWILRGDAIQLSEGDEYDLQEAEVSYLKALELEPDSAEAYASLGHFTFAVKDDARGSLHYFQRALELGAGESARDGLREAMDELAEFGD